MLSLLNFTPNDPVLQNVIEYYYFLTSEEVVTRKQFVHFPHYRTTLNVYFNADVTLNNKGRIITHHVNNDLAVVFTNNTSTFKEATIEGHFNIIGIAFKPLGFNHFINQDLVSFAPGGCNILRHYWNHFEEAMLQIKNESNLNTKVSQLDAFFGQQYRPFANKMLIQIVSAIMESQGMITVNQLESKFHISRRTLLRLFKKHLNCSISHFKRIVKFRASLSNYLQSQEKPSLTQLSYMHEYYDQSDFINQFKSLTGTVPSKLLSELMQVGQRDIYWKFDH